MRGSRAFAAAAATGLSAVLALGSVAPASASTPAAGTAARSVVSAAPAPFPGKTPAAVLALSVKAAKAASSFHLHGVAVDTTGTTTMDLVIGKLGARGSITDSSGTLQLLRVKKTVYLKAGAKYWTVNGSTPAQAKLIAGKWIGVKGNGPDLKELLALTSSSYWTAQLATLKPTARVAGKVVAKLPTIGLKATDGTIYVATKGKPYPLLLTDPADARNIVSFTQWNAKVTFKAPKALMVISI